MEKCKSQKRDIERKQNILFSIKLRFWRLKIIIIGLPNIQLVNGEEIEEGETATRDEKKYFKEYKRSLTTPFEHCNCQNKSP